MEIKKATFVISSSKYQQCPDSTLPEYAFIGRSNVGKSSLINMLTGVKDLAKISGKPGKTQLINHFLINDSWHMVDLPGYGYARVSKNSRGKWQKMMEDYFAHREQLVCTFVLIDSRIPPQRIDLEFLSYLGRNGQPLAVVFTKVDKQRQRDLMAAYTYGFAEAEKAFKEAMHEEWDQLPDMLLTSSVTGYGRQALLDYIDAINQDLRTNQ